MSNPGVRLIAECRWETLRQVLRRLDLGEGTRILDVGCGSGGDLQRIAVDFSHLRPSLHGIDLLPDRIERARQVLPPEAALRVGRAEALPYPDRQFDVVLASTVFSSILDDGLAREMAREMARVTGDDGVILCYDVRYPNPWNPHTRAVRSRELQCWFPGASVRLISLTLLPPLARRLGAFTPAAHRPLHGVPLLRSHYLAEIRPARPTASQLAGGRDSESLMADSVLADGN